MPSGNRSISTTMKRADAEAVHWTKTTFAAGLAMPLLLTAGGIATVVAFWQFTGLDAHVPFAWVYASFWLLTLMIVVPNVLISRGWLRVAWLNPAVALLQLALLAGSWLMNTEPRPWFFLIAPLPLLSALLLYRSQAYRRFVLNYYVIHAAIRDAKRQLQRQLGDETR